MKKFFRVLLVASLFIGFAGITEKASAWALEGDFYDDSGKCVVSAHNGYVNGLKVMADYVEDITAPDIHVLKLLQPYGISFMTVEAIDQNHVIRVDDGPELRVR
ncbi:hypothetical protein [Anaerovibrio sp. RM50]|uniref:hypothetical protein n=1 Tax=Anaerovibrio sp. RM50 TaxID=1200557 RepID=UPI0004891C19|nr:hypothetical protein [Anaerovibrio sp. RM50]